jgi:hypothetical protein
MKMSLQDLFDVDHATMFINFASQPTHTAYTWAVRTITNRLAHVWTLDDRYSLEKIELRNYLSDAIKHYQGNLDEFYHQINPAVREEHVEPQLIDLLNTVA